MSWWNMYLPLPARVNRVIGLALITIGFFLATPPGFIPDDFLDVIVAGFLTANFGIPPYTALFLSYTLIAWSLILIGAMIYPYNTERLLISSGKKVYRLIVKCLTNPVWFIGLVIGSLILYFIMHNYYSYITSMVSL